ncbi:cation-transporting P-type ATPase [Methylobacter svalbardensis]|uniref:cation-transporting P-type ATPase n=1 Tax=Methylobacter svalbardensis TaxID=3080016 RepID=UPI0030EB7236
MNAWHNLSIAEAASLLDTDVEQGLSGNEAKQRLARYGPNKLRKGKRFSALVIFVSQFRSLVIWVLIGAAAVSAALGETADGIAIIAIVILNAVIGFIQEYRAEKAAAALARLAAPIVVWCAAGIAWWLPRLKSFLVIFCCSKAGIWSLRTPV